MPVAISGHLNNNLSWPKLLRRWSFPAKKYLEIANLRQNRKGYIFCKGEEYFYLMKVIDQWVLKREDLGGLFYGRHEVFCIVMRFRVLNGKARANSRVRPF